MAMRLFVFATLLLTMPAPTASRRVYGYTAAEWHSWMNEWTDHDWAVHCAGQSSFTTEQWEEYLQQLNWSTAEWIRFWVNPANW